MYKWLAVLLVTLLPLTLWAVAAPAKPVAGMVHVLMKTSLGDVELDLDKAHAPLAVENFVKYAKDGHYTKTVFHRVISGFMVQGGGMDDQLKERPTRAPIKNESANGLSNVRGAVACARTSDPDSATSQFYINHADNPRLDGKPGSPGYTVFGKVVKGMDVVDKMAAVATGNQGGMANVPVNPVYLLAVTVKE